MKKPRDNKDSALGAKDWAWLGMVILCVCLVGLGLAWIATRVGTSTAVGPSAVTVVKKHWTAPPPPDEVTVVTWPAPAEVLPEPPPVYDLPQEEAVKITVDALRQNAKNDPNAPDVLSEERIRAIEARGALIN